MAEGTNLAAGFTMGAAKMLGFDPEEVKTRRRRDYQRNRKPITEP
jgi:hypothetical protein